MELHFGKPYANFYIDDLAINPYTDSFEKETGIYDINIEPRSFNSVEYFDDFIIKKSNNIDGELFYYKNIPNELINLFPKLITFTDCTITLEKIKGINISYLYSNKLLTIDNLNIILKNIEKIHNHNNCCEILNIYDNYEKKLTKRYLDYDYGLIDNSEKMYSELKNKLLVYENNKNGLVSMIHGDPVFTNIILCNNNEIKFIDMRGKIGNKKTIYGDILYDYAKIYQSIIGYDFILNDVEIDAEYINIFKTHFEHYIINKYNNETFLNIKTITNSLLFSLIPLHNNEKCKKYINLL